MGISNRLDETLDALDLTSAAAAARDSAISGSMSKLRGRMSDLDIKIDIEKPEVVAEEPKARYEKAELADVARSVYRENICPRDEKSAEEREKTDDKPNTIASRANMKALARSLAGLRTSGNEGKTSQVGPNGVGNVGKLSPTGANGSGNMSNQFDNYYALTTDMTLEQYEEYVTDIFNEEEEQVEETVEVTEVDNYQEDVVAELEQKLVTLGSTSWIEVDKVLRETAKEHNIAPRTISREFRAVHGVYPDKWIKEHLEVEVCGYMPLEEAARLNKVGSVYEVTFMFRGGTNRLKFFWPMPGQPSKEEMQMEVEKFWPKARLLAYYPTMDTEQQTNYMVMAPPMTENYHFLQPDVWFDLSESVSEFVDFLAEEEGEPISPILNEDNGYSLYIENHDTGEEQQIFFNEEGLRDWFGKSKSKDGKKGWVNVVTGDSCASDKPGEGIPKCVSSSKRASMSKSERSAAAAKKRRDDPGQQSKSGAAKPTNVKTDVKEELVAEESDKKGKKSGTKDACYHKVKSRYSVWPSAYASGALVKCRKKGAANWGNSSKKEEVEHVDEACWDTHEQRGMKKKGGKMVPNCVPKGSVSEGMTDSRKHQLDVGERPEDKGPRKMTSDEKQEYDFEMANLMTPSEQARARAKDRARVAAAKAKPKTKPGYNEYGVKISSIAKNRERNRRIMQSEDYDTEKRKEIIDGMKRKKGDFVKRYGKDAPDVMYATATKLAKKKGDTSKSDDRYAYENYVPGESDPETNPGLDEACWKGYEKKGMKTMFGKRYPNCVKKTKSEETEYKPGMKDMAKSLLQSAEKHTKQAATLRKNKLSEGEDKYQMGAHGAVDDTHRDPNDGPAGNLNRKPAGHKENKAMASRAKANDPAKKAKDAQMLKALGPERYAAYKKKMGEGLDLMGFADALLEDDMKGMSQKSGDKRSTESGAGMTAQGVAKYRRRNPGSKLKTAVTTPPSKLKPGSKAAGRRKSFCARSRSWTGERGKAARRRWNC